MVRALVLFAALTACAPEHPESLTVSTPPVEETTRHAPDPVRTEEGLFVIVPERYAVLPGGPEGEQIRRGHALVMDTHRLLPEYVGDGLNCTNCHLKAGATPKAAPWIGVDTRYPKYRKRSGRVDDLQDRINGCMQRSENGRPLERDSEPMLAMVAYMGWLSEGVEDGTKVADIGMPRITAPSPPDRENGRALFEQKCTACHGADGQGVFDPEDRTMFPPLWGERSYNVGAGMARLNTSAAFIKWNMPLNQGGTLTDQEAYDIASYFIFQDRPDLPGKEKDWPKDAKPEDARY